MFERVASEPHVRLQYYCSSYHIDSALNPIISQLSEAAGIERGDTAEQKFAKLESMLGGPLQDLSKVQVGDAVREIRGR